MPTRVVIVDDSAPVAATLEIGLSAAGFDAIAVERPAQAIAQLDAGANVLITDLDMPRMDGYELIAKLRGDARHRNLIVIVVSGSTAPDAEARARSAGADAFFEKPCSPADLRREIDRLSALRTKVQS